MPRAVIQLPSDAYLLCTTWHEDKYWVGKKMKSPHNQAVTIEVILIVERYEDGDEVYDIYVQPV